MRFIIPCVYIRKKGPFNDTASYNPMRPIYKKDPFTDTASYNPVRPIFRKDPSKGDFENFDKGGSRCNVKKMEM